MVLRKSTGLNSTTVHGSWIMFLDKFLGCRVPPRLWPTETARLSSSSPPHLLASTILHGFSMLLKNCRAAELQSCTTHTAPAKAAFDNGVLTTLVRGPRSDAPITLQLQHGCGSFLPKLGRDR